MRMSRTPRRPVVVPAVVPVVVLAAALAGVTGCADATTTTTTTTSGPAPAATPEASSPAKGEPATPAPPAFGRGPSARRPSGAYDLVLREVTVQEMERERGRGSADRVVLRFRGTGRPGWSARYVDRAVLEGSGDVVELAGDVVLRIDVTGTPTRPAGTGRPPRLAEPRGDVADLRAYGAAEGVTQVFVGLAGGRAPFRVVARTDPARLVVDLR